ncbi:sensor histidine kinase [Holdemania massiliensis]|uniref:sensor histidine kinase n=1 Tax=Holdemania massiliensis TaxID=1468449 RepID=UPI001F06ACAA|nr:GHKL domain-containing protein [Holdemania massiliensis]MCH1942401.1 GHKL domain-containing protein [Holdemania massiliensis]
MKGIDLIMVLLFPVLDFLPFSLPRYWLFKDKLRIPFPQVVLLQLLLISLNCAVFYAINQAGLETAAQWTTLVRYGFMLVFLALSFLLIRESFPKQMFTYLLFLAWMFFVLGNANYIESRFFWTFSDEHPYLIYNVARSVLYLITCPFLIHFFYHTVGDALKMEDPEMWRSLWIIPLFSALFGMLYCTTQDVYAYASWQFLVSRYLMLFGACYASGAALKILQTSRARAQMEEALKYAGRSLQMQKKQYDALAATMAETRKARHDLRQHLTVMHSFIEKDDKQGLQEYLVLVQNELPPEKVELFSCNEVVNAVIGYYAAQARSHKIRFEVKVDYPQACPISATEITVLLGNLLENAVEGCLRDPAEARWIQLRIQPQGHHALLILTDNSCTQSIRFSNSLPLSSKREGMGIGVASIQDIAAAYRGYASFEKKEDVFSASVYLRLPD